MASKVAEKPQAAIQNKEPKQPGPVRYCLSGNGKVVLGRKSKFSMGGDMTLKSKLIREVIEGEQDKTISAEAREHARGAWPQLVKSLSDGSHPQVKRARAVANKRASDAAEKEAVAKKTAENKAKAAPKPAKK